MGFPAGRGGGVLIASGNLLEHIADPPWRGCTVQWGHATVTLMSGCIAVMMLTAVVLAGGIVFGARRRRAIPTGGHNALEALVVFVRDMIARPALHEQAYVFLPFLLTLFVFVLGMNLVGMIPLLPLTQWLGELIPWMQGRTVGGTPTSVPAVCAGLSALALLTIVCCGLWRAACRKHEHSRRPMWLCLLFSPLLWLKGLSPEIPGLAGLVLLAPLATLEVLGAAAKCAALMIRLVANIVAGHILLAVLMMFAMQALRSAMETDPLFFGVSILCVLGSVAVTILDLLVACLQAYILTFLTAMFLGLYVEPSH